MDRQRRAHWIWSALRWWPGPVPRGWRLAALMSEAVLNRLDLELRLKSCVVNVCLERYFYSMDFVLMCSYDTVVHDVPLLPCY